MPDRYELADIAGRIAATENRLQKLRHHVARLEQEGSDARVPREAADFLSNNLGDLYSRQLSMRRTSWTTISR